MKSGNKKAFTSHFVLKTGMMRYSIHINSQSAIHHPKFRIIHCSAVQLLAAKSLWCELSTSTLFFTLFTGCSLVLTIIILLHKYLLTLGTRGFFTCGGRPTHLRLKADTSSAEGRSHERGRYVHSGQRSDSFRAGHCQVSGRNHKGPRLVNMVMGIQVKVIY